LLIPQAYLLLKRENPADMLDYTQVVESITKRKDFCYVEIVDSKGNVKVPLDMIGRQTHTNSIKNGPWGSIAIGRDYIIREEKYDDVGPVIEGIFGIVESDRILGYVVMGVSTAPIIRSLWKGILIKASVLVMLLLIASFFSLKFAGKAIAPVLALSSAVETYPQSENLDNFNIRGPREVEVLASQIKNALGTIKNSEEEMKKAVKNKTEHLRKAQQEMKAILDGFRKLSKSFRLEDAAKNICEIARSIVYCNAACVILSVSEDGSEIIPAETLVLNDNAALTEHDQRSSAKREKTSQPNFIIYPKTAPAREASFIAAEVILKVLAKKEIEIVANIKKSEYADKIHTALKSCAVYPLISGEGKQFGILFLGMSGDTQFDNEEISVLNSLLEPIGMALDNVFLYSQVEKLATCDSMTGLLNHQNIREKLVDALKIAKRQENAAFVIMGDLDKFKRLNDTFGHPVGDKVIKEFANIIKSSRRVGEYVGRLGGEEFLIVLGNTNIDGASAVADRIMNDVRSAEIPLGQDDKVTFRVSMGIAGFPQDGNNMDELIDKADRALYVAKSRGRDQYVVWNHEIERETKDLKII